MRQIDLHVHTTASDGTFTPTEAVKLAHSLGLEAIAVTDHDTVAGFDEARKAGEKLGVELVPGIEISTHFGRAVHILGYYIDPKSRILADTLVWMIRERDVRNRRMVEAMAADGIPISYERMRDRFGTAIGRPNFGQILVELGYASSVQDAFDRFIEKGQKYYRSRKMLSIERTVETILRAGGVAVLAHPFQYRLDDAGLRELIEHCLDYGLGGMECLYSGYTAEQSAYLLRLAREYGLTPTGGSDFHGLNKPAISMGSGKGDLFVPYELLEGLKERKAKSSE